MMKIRKKINEVYGDASGIYLQDIQCRELLRQLVLPVSFPLNITSLFRMNKETRNEQYHTHNSQRYSQWWRKAFEKVAQPQRQLYHGLDIVSRTGRCGSLEPEPRLSILLTMLKVYLRR